MSLGKQIAERRNKQRRVIETPSHWGEDDAPLFIYCTPITAGEINKIQRKHKNFLNEMTVDGMVDLIIMKAEDEGGNRLFTLEDKIYLMAEDAPVVADIAGKMFGEHDSIEEAEKN